MDQPIDALIEKLADEKELNGAPELRPIGATSVFNNQYADLALQKMTPEQRLVYEQAGNKMYGNYSYETAGLQGIGDKPETEKKAPDEDIMGETLTEATAYILEAIKAGMHPYDLEQNEKDTLRLQLGALWMEPYGYRLEDVEQPPEFRKPKD